jgi:hypothetical protein
LRPAGTAARCCSSITPSEVAHRHLSSTTAKIPKRRADRNLTT